MGLFNYTNVIGVAIEATTNNVTGDLATTLVFIYIILLAFCLMFRVPMIISLPLTMVFLIVAVAYTSGVVPLVIMVCVYLAAMTAKLFWLN